jgi:polysaccharide biosynthesis transport protein
VREISTYAVHRINAEPISQPWSAPPPEFVTSQRGPELRDYLRIIRRHLKLIASLFGGALLVTGLVVVAMTPVYTAHSTILVEPRAPQVLDIRNLISESDGSDEHDYFKTQQQILLSRSLAAQVIRELGLQRSTVFSDRMQPEGLFGGLMRDGGAMLASALGHETPKPSADMMGVDGETIDRYLKHLTVTPEIGTRLFTVGFSMTDPALAAKIANAHVQAYIRRGMEIHAQASEEAREFLEKKLVELKERVEKSEAALNDYRRDRGIVSFTLDDKDSIMNQRLTELNQALTKAETDRIDLEAQEELIHKRNYNLLPAVINSTLIQNLKAQTDLLAAQHASMASQFKPDFPPLKELKAKLDESRANLEAEIAHVVGGIESSYQSALARENSLHQQVELEKSKALSMNDASLQDAVLAREVDANRQLYKSVLERMKEIGVAGEVPNSNVSIIDAAAAPQWPSSPRKLLDLSLAGVFSLFFGVGLAFLLDHLDDGLHNPEEAEIYLGLPSLGAVPDFAALEFDTGGSAVPDLPAAPATAPLAVADGAAVGREIVIQRNRFSVASESYRAIRTAILLSRAGEAPKTVLVASGAKSEGKTVTAANIAMAFAQMGGRVLLVDADLRRARCHEVLGVHNLMGLTEVLVGQKQAQEVIRRVGTANLAFLSAGSVPPNPTELLASQRMSEVLAELITRYDRVVIDSPPVMPVSDSVILSRIVDGVVMVVGARTPKQLVRHACARLGQVGGKILGIVLNQVNLSSPDYYHYQRYNAYEDYYKPASTVSHG